MPHAAESSPASAAAPSRQAADAATVLQTSTACPATAPIAPASAAAAAEAGADTGTAAKLPARALSVAAFAPFGQVITPVPDGTDFAATDAQLVLAGPQPRFYGMRLGPRRGPLLELARHRRCTQCLASADHRWWWLVVAPPDEARPSPEPSQLQLFAIPPGLALMLHRGTWHGGPFHRRASACFFNLELSDTNRQDRQLWRLPRARPLQLRRQPAQPAQPDRSSRQPQ